MKKYFIYYENEVEVTKEEAPEGMSEKEVAESYDYKTNARGVEGDSAEEFKTREEMLAKVDTSRAYRVGAARKIVIDLSVGVEYDEDEEGNIENFEYHFAPKEPQESI